MGNSSISTHFASKIFGKIINVWQNYTYYYGIPTIHAVQALLRIVYTAKYCLPTDSVDNSLEITGKSNNI